MTAALSVVMPVWNEEAVIGSLLEEIDRNIARRLPDVEIVVVDDASTDGTPLVLAELERTLAGLQVIRLGTNVGHGGAVLTGLHAARGDWVFQLDSDGQVVVQDFWKLWEAREQADLVLGIRVERRDPLHRVLLSRVIAAVVSVLVRRRFRDPNVPFRLLRRGLREDLLAFLGPSALAPSILMVVGAQVRGWRVVEVPVGHRARKRGTSSLRAWRLVRFSLRGLAELVRFRLAIVRAPRRRP